MDKKEFYEPFVNWDKPIKLANGSPTKIKVLSRKEGYGGIECIRVGYEESGKLLANYYPNGSLYGGASAGGLDLTIVNE